MAKQPPAKFERRPAKPTLRPRKVTGGIRVRTAELWTKLDSSSDHAAAAPAWAAARWMRPVEIEAPNAAFAEGIEYATSGQASTVEISAGQITARVQGRLPRPYDVNIRIPTFGEEQWAKAISAISDHARFGAAILSGELPHNIEDIFAPLGLHLFPSGAEEFAATTTYNGKPISQVWKAYANDLDPRDEVLRRIIELGGRDGLWTKHVCCTMAIVAEKLAESGLLIFRLRGLPEADLLDRLRHQRTFATRPHAATDSVPVYEAHVDPVSSINTPLDEQVDQFWTSSHASRDALRDLDLSLDPPEVSHPLLRRLGRSPFEEAKFPLTGLLATVYDVVSERVRDRAYETSDQNPDEEVD